MVDIQLNHEEENMHKVFGLSDERFDQITDEIMEINGSTEDYAELLDRFFKSDWTLKETFFAVFQYARTDGEKAGFNKATEKMFMKLIGHDEQAG